MKKHIKNIVSTVRNARQKTESIPKTKAAAKLAEQNGQFIVEHAAVFAVILVIAAIAITLFVTYLQGDFSSLITGKINDLFN